MASLAEHLQVARTTLHRWTGDRDQLISDVLRAETKATLDALAVRANANGFPSLDAVVEMIQRDMAHGYTPPETPSYWPTGDLPHGALPPQRRSARRQPEPRDGQTRHRAAPARVNAPRRLWDEDYALTRRNGCVPGRLDLAEWC